MYDVISEEQRILHGKDTGGIGAVQISPDGTYFMLVVKVEDITEEEQKKKWKKHKKNKKPVR